MKPQRRQEGSMSVVVAGIAALIVCLGAAFLSLAQTYMSAERARISADSAALGAATALLQPGGSLTPCTVAAQLATANGGRLLTCQVLATSVQVSVAVATRWGRDAEGLARAGEPEAANARESA